MIRSLHPRAFCWFERVILLVAGLFLLAHSIPRAWRTLNTDFPNYYMAARLAHEGYDTSRMYEWQWIERETDHRGLDIRVIGLLPITPFSTLAVYSLAGLEPLTAKHIWILLSLTCLIPIGWMLRVMTGLSSQRIAILILLSFPLYRNLLYGQFYVLLLLMIVAACFSYLRGYRVLAGALLAIAAACKIFPVLCFCFFCNDEIGARWPPVWSPVLLLSRCQLASSDGTHTVSGCRRYCLGLCTAKRLARMQ